MEVDQIAASESAKLLAKRQAILSELITTEQNYVNSLKTVTELYINPLRSILSKAELGTLFSNLEAILEVNDALLKDLEARTDKVGDLFLQRADLFKIYAVYCSNQPRLTKTIKNLKKNTKFLHAIEKANRDPRSNLMQLEDFLILPMQRITRYPMLLNSLEQATNDNDEEKADLEIAAAKIKNITALINERTRQVEAVEKLVEIQSKIIGGEALGLVAPGRSCIHEGKLRFKKMLTSNLDNPWAFLFSDMLMLCSRDTQADAFIVKKVIPFDAASSVVFTDAESDGDAETIEISIQNNGTGSKQTVAKQYKVKAFGKAEKDKWLKHFRTIEENKAVAAAKEAAESEMDDPYDAPSASDVKASAKEKLGNLRAIQASDTRISAIGTWRESRSLSRPALSGIISPREGSKLERTNSVKSLASPKATVAAPGSDKLVRRTGVRDLTGTESPERRRHTHTRERSSTYGGGAPPLSLLTEEEKRELEAYEFPDNSKSDPNIHTNQQRSSRRLSNQEHDTGFLSDDEHQLNLTIRAPETVAPPLPAPAPSLSSSGGPQSPMPNPTQFAPPAPPTVTFSPAAEANGTSSASNSPTTAALSKRASKSKLNLRAISQFAASVIRGKRKDDKSPKHSDAQPETIQTARAVLMTEEPPQSSEPSPVEVPSVAGTDSPKLGARASLRLRKGAITERDFLPPIIPQNKTDNASSSESESSAATDGESSYQSTQNNIMAQALIDVFRTLSDFDDNSDEVQLVPRAGRSPAVRHALELLKRTSSEENSAFISSLLSRFPPSRKSGQFSRVSSAVDLASSPRGRSSTESESHLRLDPILESPRSPRSSNSAPNLRGSLSSPRLFKPSQEKNQ